MDTVSTIYLASFVGAGLFFGSGYLLRSLRQSPSLASLSDPPADQAAAAEAAALRQQVAQLQQQAQQAQQATPSPPAVDEGLRQEIERLRHALAAAEGAQAKAMSKAEAAAEKSNGLQQELVRLKAARVASPETKRLHQQLADLRQQKASLQQLVDELTNDRTISEEDDDEDTATAVRKPGEDIASQAAVTDQAIARVETAEAVVAKMRGDLQRAEKKAQLADQRKAEVSDLQLQLADLQRKLAAAEQQAEKRAASELTRLSSEGEGLRRRNTELQQQLEQLRQQTVTLRDDAERLRTDAGRAGDAESEVKGLRIRLEAAEAKAAEAENLRDQIADLRQQLGSSEHGPAQAEELEQLKRKERDLLVKSQLMRQRIEELEQYADENVQLRERVQHLEPHAKKTAELQQQVRELEAEIFAAGIRAAAAAENPPTATGIRTSKEGASAAGTVGGTLDDRLAELTHSGNYSAAVLADVQGLPLAAAGDKPYHESLAAVSSLVREMASRAQDLLPLGSPRLVEIVDANDIGVRSRLFFAESETLVLTTLGTRLAPADRGVEGLIASLPAIISTHEGRNSGK